MADIEKILVECKKNLERGRAVATGRGVFAVIIVEGDRVVEQPRQFRVLLRRRPEAENTSLISGGNFSGKWELPGGGMELKDLQVSAGKYQGDIYETLVNELGEEAGLHLVSLPPFFVMIPASYFNEERGIADEANAVVLSIRDVVETPKYDKKVKGGELRFFSPEEIGRIEIVSQRFRFLISRALEYAEHYWPAPEPFTPHP